MSRSIIYMGGAHVEEMIGNKNKYWFGYCNNTVQQKVERHNTGWEIFHNTPTFQKKP